MKFRCEMASRTGCGRKKGERMIVKVAMTTMAREMRRGIFGRAMVGNEIERR